MSLVLRCVVLALLACTACQSPSDEATRERESASSDEQSVTVVLHVDGTFTLEGKAVPADEFAAEYGEVVMRRHSKTRNHAGTLRLVIADPAQTTWAQLTPGFIGYFEHFGQALFIQEHEVFTCVCINCYMEDHYHDFAAMQLTAEMNVEAMRAELQPAAGSMALVDFQPTCTLDVFLRAIRAMNESDIAYLFNADVPQDGSLISVSDFTDYETEDPEDYEEPIDE